MPETVTIRLSPEQLVLFETGNPHEKEKLIENLFESLEDDAAANLLSGFCTGAREVYDFNPIVDDVTFDDTASGLIYVNFTGSAYFGCKNMDRSDDHDATVVFEIDRETSAITFTTDPPDPIERFPNEEF